ncbi:MAG: hypothetical protein ACRD6X_06930 [Pyrinomonadaceae bacterium]
MTKSLIVFSLMLSLFGFQVRSCDSERKSDEMIKFGPDKFTSIVVFFKKETTTEQKEAFENTVISKPHPEGKGHDLPDGVVLSYFIRNGDYEGYGLTFSTDATPRQREQLKKAINESSIVYKVYEDVVPNEIKDL